MVLLEFVGVCVAFTHRFVSSRHLLRSICASLTLLLLSATYTGLCMYLYLFLSVFLVIDDSLLAVHHNLSRRQYALAGGAV